MHYALTTDSAVRCWGFNVQGQLGHGHTSNIGDDELPSSAGDVPYQSHRDAPRQSGAFEY